MTVVRTLSGDTPTGTDAQAVSEIETAATAPTRESERVIMPGARAAMAPAGRGRANNC